MSLRIAHATDIHWFAPPTLRDFAPKRVVGTLNLYGLGRRHAFDPAVQSALVAHLRQLRPDLVVITGDLTAQALPAEFALARKALQPLLDEVPTLVLPGNHDVYTPTAKRRNWFGQAFAPWGGTVLDGGVVRQDVGSLTVLGLDPNRPTWFTASGRIPDAQLRTLAALLAADGPLAGRKVLLALHYPPIDRRGELYDNARHGLSNARELVAVLQQAAIRPAAILCGHVHHGFRATLSLSDGAGIPVMNCGSSGHTYLPERGWAAATAEVDLSTPELQVRRWIHDGAAFVLEAGGAFASGG